LTSRSASSLFTPRKLSLLLALCAAGVAPGIAYAQSGAPKNSGIKDNGSYGPIVAIVSPEYADVLKGETKIVIAVEPRRYPAAGVELLVDGKAVTGVLPAQTKFTWKTSLFVDGPHTLGVRVTDTQGFIGQAETMVYINNARKADNSAPILRWLGVQDGQKLSGIANVRVEAGDDFGVKYVFLTVNSAITPDIKPAIASWIINRPPYEVALDTTRFKDGMYVLDALAFDAADNERNAPRLTVGFFNSVPDSPATPDTGAPAESPAAPPKSGDPVAPNTSSSSLIVPPRTTPPTPPQVVAPQAVAPPQSTVTTTATGWIATTPAPTHVAAAPTPSERIITTSNAKISRPPLPARAVPERAVPVIKSTTPTPAAPVPAAPTPAATAPAATAPVAAPSVRIARTQSDKVAQAPSVTVAGPDNSANAPAISTKSLNNQRLAAAPEVRWTTPGEFRSSARTGSASTTLSSHANAPLALSTPSLPTADIAPLAAETHALQLTAPQPATPQIKAPVNSSAQLSQSTLGIEPNTRIAAIESNRTREPLSVAAVIAALPASAMPRTASVPTISKPAAVSKPAAFEAARTTPITQTQDARRVFTTPLSTARVTAGSTPSLPTAPRLAFSPNLSQPNAPAPASAAIVVSPLTEAPAVHIAQNNETLAAIARRYKMPVSAIAAANDLKANAKIVKGTKVLLPQALLVSYQGQAVTGDVAPFLIGSTSIAPFRFLFEKQGGTMTWDSETQRVTARNANYEVNLEIGSDKALVNQKEVMMDMAAFLLSGRTMVPVRFFEKALQAKVEWEPSTGRIFVAMTP
jgi:LysM repeat protein